MGHAGHGRRPARADPRRARRLDRHAPERDRRRGDRPLVLRAGAATRNRIVYEEANFPSVRYLYQAQPELEVVAVADDAAIVDAIDERTLLVPISHVLFKNGEIQDVEPIVRRAHEVGALRGARLLPVGRRRAVRPDRARRRLRRRRQRQVALRRARAPAGSTCGPTSPSGSSRRSSAGRRTPGRSPSSRSSSTPPARGASSPARRTCPRSTPRRPATT